MLRMLKIALVATLLAVAAAPAFTVPSFAGDDSLSDAYSHKHDNHGW
jgi:hypothetical protein